ncbi:MAG: GNAT family N-acetyltransferase [Bacteroidales bacterium]
MRTIEYMRMICLCDMRGQLVDPRIGSKQITIKDKNFAQNIYISNFPRQERRLWSEVMEMTINNKSFNFYIIKCRNYSLGIVSVWKFEEFIYIEHFAIDKRLRNCGIGSYVLQLIKECYASPIVLEVEPLKDELTARRINFYKRNGFYLLKDRYVQPPYNINLPSVEMQIMTTSQYILFEQIRSTLYKNVYSNYPIFLT